MKVLICIPCLLTGGTEIQTLSLVRALIQNGNQVTTVCYFEYSPDMVDCYQKAGSKVICLSFHGERVAGIKGVIFLLKGLRRMKKKEKPDIVHVQYMTPGAIPILLLRLLNMKNIIATVHTTADIYSSLKLPRFIQKYCVRVFTCVTLKAEESFFGESTLYTQRIILRKRNHFTIYNALPAYIQIRNESRDLNKSIVIGAVSRLEAIKGMDLIIPVFKKVKDLYPEITLLIVGDGSQKAWMCHQAKELGIEDAVSWFGKQRQSQLTYYYDQIDILLMPSRSEGFGLTAIEGMARGCVVVASDISGLSEVVKDKEVGLLHLRENVDDMVDKICYLVKNPQIIRKYSDNSMEYVKRFNPERYCLLFNDLYKKLI